MKKIKACPDLDEVNPSKKVIYNLIHSGPKKIIEFSQLNKKFQNKQHC